MAQHNLALVTGANGHLGNNLVRLLIEKGIPVRASVRNIKNKEPFIGLDCEVVQADITDKNSLLRALQGVETFYAVGAAFKLWAKDPKKDIYDVNMQGTQNLVEAAAEAGVKRIVYVSSIAALNYTHTPTNENNGYNPDRRDMYYNSKNDGEKLAFELAKKHNIELVAVLPSAMIGSEAFGNLSVSYNVINLILKKQVPVETDIKLNWVDVKDVAEGCYLAATKGVNGERYILANEKCTSIKETTQIAQKLFPELKIKLPIAVPKPLLFLIAWFMEIGSKFTGKAPLLSVKDLAMFSGLQQDFDISKARKELGFNPKKPETAIKEAMHYLKNKSVLVLILFSLFSTVSFAQTILVKSDTTKIFVSLETDPAFWAGTLPNGLGFDANLDFRLAKYPRFRFGILGYTGKWSGDFGKTILLTNDFYENDWTTQWNGFGVEAQYQFRFGLERGGLQPGLRLQWNQFIYQQNNTKKCEANHFVITPQIGFQWFPFKKIGLYLLPWAGVQIPTLGTDKLTKNGEERATRKLMPVITAHIGWEFKF
ncbi:NAD-dependent epimerase/dehydratase family protein [Thermoflexibacter ruber]|uniref:Dihydroflavonol-4-reductase n=1 Tax=Thermoflexibacter ruber TaxID=1003 RepID=A0A1I2JZV3_9BACT|nr:NAD-dependent epimerase/dehydratase family protein [Thermoflexibacter ruber]SFF59683.1 dihydroflavonol-4-reductase [Thermoflexibacter ruber]